MQINISIEVEAVAAEGKPTRRAWVRDVYSTGDGERFMGADTRQALQSTIDDLNVVMVLFDTPDRPPSAWLKRDTRVCGSESTS